MTAAAQADGLLRTGRLAIIAGSLLSRAPSAEVQARPTFRETATAALGEVSTRIGAALRTPSPPPWP